MSATIWGVLMGVIAVMAGIIRWQVRRWDKEAARKIGAELKAAKQRVEINETVNADPDIVARARNAGIVRPDNQ